MNLKFDITLKEYKIVLDILRKYLKTPAKIWIFGSRAKHKTKRNSDLDIAIESIKAIPFGVLADLEEAFTDAPLPYTVDIVEINSVKTEFQNIINQHKVLLTIIGNIPKLRFPEFRDAGEWVETTLEECLNYLQPTPYLVKNTDYKDKYKIPVLTAGKTFILGYTDEKKGVFEDKLPAIIFDDFTTVSKFVDFPFKVKSSAIKILLVKEENDIKFLFEAMQNLKFQVGTHKRHWISVYSSLSILKPFNPKEQQKIAACLTALDDLISAVTGRLDALKQHKQGLMQQLFPAQGETVPRLRFPEFRDAGEWVKKTLIEVADYENGKAHEKDIDEHGKYIVVNSKFISTEGEAIKYSNTSYCPVNKGDILMVLSDVPNGKAIAKCFYVNQNDRYSVNQRICKITVFHADKLFLFYMIDRNPYFLAFDDGVNQTNLRKDDVLNFSFLLSENQQEQQKIAACLTALDDLISAQTQKIAKLKTHKRGLMQGLFPKIEN